MSSEPRFSSQVPTIKEKSDVDHSLMKNESSDLAQDSMIKQYETLGSIENGLDHSSRPKSSQTQVNTSLSLNLSGPRPQRAMILSCSFVLFTIVMLLAFILGESNAVYQFIYGEGGAHLLSQSCTLALFCWGGAVAILRFSMLRKEQRSIQKMQSFGRFSDQSLQYFDELFIGAFIQELSENIHLVSGYLEARTSFEISRDRLLEQVDQLFRGIRAAMWLIPLSGFLGTVIGMSLTIGRFDELFLAANGDHVKLIGLSDLAPAIQGLGTAFDTTLLALALVIPLKLALVALENLSEQVLQQIESKLTLPYLQQTFQSSQQSEPNVSHDLMAVELTEYIKTLDTQSMSLNQHLADTSRYLHELRESIMSHPALSRQAQEQFENRMSSAIQQGLSQIQTETENPDLMTPLQQLVVQQRNLNERLSLIQTSLEAPIVLQRAPKAEES